MKAISESEVFSRRVEKSVEQINDALLKVWNGETSSVNVILAYGNHSEAERKEIQDIFNEGKWDVYFIPGYDKTVSVSKIK